MRHKPRPPGRRRAAVAVSAVIASAAMGLTGLVPDGRRGRRPAARRAHRARPRTSSPR